MGDAETKICPDCAEEVREAADVCRYCGHAFRGGRVSERRRMTVGVLVVVAVVAAMAWAMVNAQNDAERDACEEVAALTRYSRDC